MQNAYRFAFCIVVVHRLGQLSIQQVLGVCVVWVVYGPGPLGVYSMSPILVSFCRFMVHNDPCFVHSLHFIGCTDWGIGAFDKKQFYQICVSLTCVLSFVKMIDTPRSFVSHLNFVLFFCRSVFFKRHSLFKSIRLMVGEERMMPYCLILISFSLAWNWCI